MQNKDLRLVKIRLEHDAKLQLHSLSQAHMWFHKGTPSAKIQAHINGLKVQRMTLAQYEEYADQMLIAINDAIERLQENLYKSVARETQERVDRQVLKLRKKRQVQLVFPEILEAGLSGI